MYHGTPTRTQKKDPTTPRKLPDKLAH
jgi:hypothetical protein